MARAMGHLARTRLTKPPNLTGPKSAVDAIVIAAHELNRLLRLARAWRVGVRVDTVERDGYTEVLVDVKGPESHDTD